LKITAEKMMGDRLLQIDEDLKREYFKGHRKNKSKIAKLFAEKSRINEALK